MVEVLTTLEQNVGACVLGTGLTAGVLWVGFRAAGFRLGLTCRPAPMRRRRKDQDAEDCISPEEKEANEGYHMASSKYQAALTRLRTQEAYRNADKADQEAERIREELEKKRAFQEQRVAELDAVRAERRAKAAAESAAVEEDPPSDGEPGEPGETE